MFTSPQAEGPHAESTAEPAEVVTIGDELCRGEIVDSNSAWIAERLTALGLHVRWRSSTTDDAADMDAALRQAAGRARVVVCSGGLGPTDDDRTVDVAARLVGVEPVVDEAHRRKMEQRFAERSFKMTPNNLRQVRVPSGSEALTNPEGLAPGFRLEHGGAELYFLPGVPREMKAIFEGSIAPRLERAQVERGAPLTARRVWRVIGLGESHVDHRLAGLLDGIPGATLHYRISFPETLVTAIVRRPAREEAERVVASLDGAVRERLGGAVYATGDGTLARAVGERLLARGETVATAESCTGGLVGDLLTDVPGSSRYYVGGVVCYSNDLKQRLLGVEAATLAEAGAVSERCVRQMAEGARTRLGATWAMALSGIAGPDGGTPEKPVGLVHFAVAGPSGTEARELVWRGDRRMVKQLGAAAALNLLHKQLTPERASAPDSPYIRSSQGKAR